MRRQLGVARDGRGGPDSARGTEGTVPAPRWRPARVGPSIARTVIDDREAVPSRMRPPAWAYFDTSTLISGRSRNRGAGRFCSSSGVTPCDVCAAAGRNPKRVAAPHVRARSNPATRRDSEARRGQSRLLDAGRSRGRGAGGRESLAPAHPLRGARCHPSASARCWQEDTAPTPVTFVAPTYDRPRRRAPWG